MTHSTDVAIVRASGSTWLKVSTVANASNLVTFDFVAADGPSGLQRRAVRQILLLAVQPG